VLEVTDLVVRYGKAVTALKGVDVTVPGGSVVALLGANGAGKSTLIRAVSGTLGHHRGRVERGDVRYAGRSLRGVDPVDIVTAGVVQVPEGRRVFSSLTVEENLRAGAATVSGRAKRTAARDRAYAMFPVLAERRHQKAGLLSGGEQQMLAIGRGLMASPSLLLLDEPSLGLAPRVVEQIGVVVRDINRDGTAVVLVEQNAAMALSVADTAYVLEVGRVRLSGGAAELRDSDEVQRLYLGGGEERDDAPAVPVKTLSRWAR
jgi:branched-chain amino acid transport system ATP-binding protein